MRHPARPEVTIPNHDEVYEYFEDNERSTADRNRSLERFSKLIVPSVKWVDGAQEEVDDLINNNVRIMFLMNHTNNFDSMTIGSLFWTDPVLSQISDTTRIAGKFSLFQFGPIADRIEDIGTVPIPRTKDLEEGVVSPEQLQGATEGFFDLFDGSVRERGEDWILYPGGTRNKKNRAVMPKPLAGPARMLLRANDLDEPLATVCIGDYHPPLALGTMTHLNKPSLVIGRPDSTRWERKGDASNHIQKNIQKNLTLAQSNFMALQDGRRAG